MADGGGFRFNGGPYYYQQNQQSNHPRHLHPRNGSPTSTINNSRAFFHESPSPSRSPGMFNHNSHRQNLLNGAPNHTNFQLMQKHYQNQNQHHGAHHMNQHQDHAHGHTNNYGNHNHNHSASALASSTPHFTPAHLQNGAPNNVHGGLSKPPNDHWALQLKMAQELRDVDKPHFYARNNSTYRQPSQSIITSQAQEDRDQRQRASDDTEEPNSWQAIDFGGQGLKCLSQSLFRYNFLKKIYFNQNKLSWLTPQIGTMRNLTTLDLSQNQLHELPPEIGMLTNLTQLLLFDNNLIDLPFELGYLYKLEMLGLEGNPLRDDLMEMIMEKGTTEFVRELRESLEPPEEPRSREWEMLIEQESPEEDRFTVASWNTLCDRMATQSAYGYAPSRALDWDYRKDIIMSEIQSRNADILCLQEIDQESYNEFFRPGLAADDYKGVFYQKSRAMTMGEKEAKFVDGCATFFKASKYVLLDKAHIIFSREAINRPDMKGEHDVYNRVMPKDHIAVVTFLENRATGSRVIVVNAHLEWNPTFKDVKVVQIGIMLQKITELADKYADWPACTDKNVFKYANMDSEDGVNGADKVPVEPAPSLQYFEKTEIPLVMCVDSNSVVGSGVYDLVTQGLLSSSHPDLGGKKYGDFTRHGMSHPFNLKSSYAMIDELGFTNYTPDFQNVIDYIWYSTNALTVTGLLGDVDKEYMRRVPGFPTWHFPSDHLLLMTEFSVKGRKELKITEPDFGPQRDRDRDRRP